MSYHDFLETKSEGAAPDDVPAAIAELQRALEEKLVELKGEVKAANDRADALETKLNRPGAERKTDEPTPEKKAFFGYVRGGRERLNADETKALRIADDVAGGYVVAPAEFVNDLLTETADVSPIRRLATVRQISTGGARLPRRTGGPTAYWVDEIEERRETDVTYGQALIPVHEAAAFVDVSQQLLEDAAVDIEAELRQAFAEEFGRLESEAFTFGDGVKKPHGFMADPAVLDVANGHASALQADALIDLFYSIPAENRNNAVWGMNSRTAATIRKLKDSQGNYLWTPGLTVGQPANILGRPVEEFPDMPDVAAGERPIVFGDFAAGYRIFDRINMSVLRDPYTLATRGMVRFHFRRRVGGGVVKPDVIRTLKIATSV